MRTVILGFTLAATLALGACASSGQPQYEEGAVIHQVSPEDLARIKSRDPIESERVVLYVNGLGCPLCATNIDRQLERVKGVAKIENVDLSVGKVTLALDPQKAPSPYTLSEAVEDAGFTLVKVETP